MAERDKVIKSGQVTLPRILFLALIGGLIVAMVAVGGKALIIGYWIITLAICVLLYLIATDYGVKMGTVNLAGQPAQPNEIESAPATESPRPGAVDQRVKRRPSRAARRRR
ncbi:MAG TPA: hypothetical protein VJZ26_17270 [Blastocatellia bacterium]|nr:hypothetical protein [Blastocatellia bacterium]